MNGLVVDRNNIIEEDQAQGFSKESITLRAIQAVTIPEHYYFPVSRQTGLSWEFFRLVRRWKRDVRFISSTNEMCMHPAYQRIIGFGPAALPYIFRELEQEHDHWFWALKAITGEDPIKPEHRGNVDMMTKDWLAWAIGNGYEW